MTTPNNGELLVQETRTAERLRLLLLAIECKTIEEFREMVPLTTYEDYAPTLLSKQVFNYFLNC